MAYSVSGKVALVTGAQRGIGLPVIDEATRKRADGQDLLRELDR